jgi:predicted alpha-1,2-mannosidase
VTPFPFKNWSAGLLAGHEEEAYRALRSDALSARGRSANRAYVRHGYIPTGLGCRPDCVHPASATLEYAAADAALARMAGALGHRADARELRRRARSYEGLWDRRIGFFRPRDRDGRWMTPFDPADSGDAFHEGGAYQYGWLVPQDPAALVEMLGGRRATERRLDDFFAYGDLLRDPQGTARHAWTDHAYHYYGSRTYNPNNEPDLHAPFLYAWVGRPAKTATVVRAAQSLFTDGPEGMTGNDDLGTMSAWYVLTSLGLYPTMSGAGYFVLTSPQFPHAEIDVGKGTLTVDAPGVSDTNRYVASAMLDGRPVSRTWLERSAIDQGAHLSFGVSAQPTGWGTDPAAAPPPIANSSNPVQQHVPAGASGS